MKLRLSRWGMDRSHRGFDVRGLTYKGGKAGLWQQWGVGGVGLGLSKCVHDVCPASRSPAHFLALRGPWAGSRGFRDKCGRSGSHGLHTVVCFEFEGCVEGGDYLVRRCPRFKLIYAGLCRVERACRVRVCDANTLTEADPEDALNAAARTRILATGKQASATCAG